MKKEKQKNAAADGGGGGGADKKGRHNLKSLHYNQISYPKYFFSW